jgi:hypothetical protein
MAPPFSNRAFGIDHPLITVGDLDAAAERLAALGFTVTPLGRHPWGTHNRLAVFPGDLLELMTIGDPAAVDGNTIDRQLFGTLIRDFRSRHTGVAMMALHATDLDRDLIEAQRRGLVVDGVIDFRRVVRLPDGTDDEAVVRLAMMIDRRRPGLSLFLCQQVKRHFVEVPAWMAHPNGASRLFGITYLDDEARAAEQRARMVWGEPIGPEAWSSPGGLVEVVTAKSFRHRLSGWSPSADMLARAPGIVAVTVMVDSLDRAEAIVRRACPEAHRERGRLQVPAGYLGDTVIEFLAG